MFRYISPWLVLMLLMANCYCIEAASIKLVDSPIIIYVDDDADPSWYDETHFRNITDAINASNDGDTIFVYNGTYYEKINITKSIKLIGEDKFNTIIDGTYIVPDQGEFGASIIRIFSADEITVSNFTIQNVIEDTFSVDAGFHVEGNTHYDNFTNNIIKNISNTGILLSGTNHIVSENIFMNCAQGIWYIPHYNGCSNTIISNNIFTKIGNEGIQLDMADGNTIIKNNITKCSQGIAILESNKNLIKYNNIAHNSQGVFLTISWRNKFYKNNFIDSGIGLHVEYKGYSFFNCWRRNYWDNQIIHRLPKILIGRFGILPIPFFKFDLRPAREPYDIESVVIESIGIV